jgi:hypothetical protein
MNIVSLNFPFLLELILIAKLCIFFFRTKDVINESDGIVSLWSRRQAELFIAQQSKLLIHNPTEALPPQKLQAKIRDVLATNPEHAEAVNILIGFCYYFHGIKL